jgi:hypothetical protein
MTMDKKIPNWARIISYLFFGSILASLWVVVLDCFIILYQDMHLVPISIVHISLYLLCTVVIMMLGYFVGYCFGGALNIAHNYNKDNNFS